MGVEDKQAADSHYVSEAIVEKRLDYDSDSHTGVPPEGALKRQLKNRHIAMIRCAPTPSRTRRRALADWGVVFYVVLVVRTRLCPSRACKSTLANT